MRNNSMDYMIEPETEVPATTDLKNNDVFIGDDVLYGDEGIVLIDDLVSDTVDFLVNILGWQKGEYQHVK